MKITKVLTGRKRQDMEKNRKSQKMEKKRTDGIRKEKESEK